jgi:nicotinamide-nucleotide amidase
MNTESLDRSVPDDVIQRADQLMRELAGRELRVASAESCTGGLLAALLTDVEGASHAFDRGVVTYTDDAKAELLGMERAVLEHNEAVSEAVARGMAEGMLTRSGSDLAVAITGFAGPGAPGTEEGLVHLALARRGAATVHRVCHFGPAGRGPIRDGAVRVALEMIEEGIR